MVMGGSLSDAINCVFQTHVFILFCAMNEILEWAGLDSAAPLRPMSGKKLQQVLPIPEDFFSEPWAFTRNGLTGEGCKKLLPTQAWSSDTNPKSHKLACTVGDFWAPEGRNNAPHSRPVTSDVKPWVDRYPDLLWFFLTLAGSERDIASLVLIWR